MPTIRIVNETHVPLHIALTQVGPLHWQNQVEPGEAAILKPGPVFFTIEARLARGADNEYTKFQLWVPIAVVTVSAVTLGAGAVYFAGAAAAAGSASAVIANISAQVASKMPAVRKLYKYARRSQKIARIGNIVGIGGSMLAGKKAADAEAQVVAAKKEEEAEQAAQGGFFSFGRKKAAKKEDKKQAAESMKILQGLVAGSVVSSPGWFLNRDRTLRITGGPRASEVEGLLIIETDTVQPFKIIEEDGKTLAKGKSEQELLTAGEQAQLAAAAAAEAGKGESHSATPKLRRTKSNPDEAELEAAAAAEPPATSSDSDSDSDDETAKRRAGAAPAANTVKGRFAQLSAAVSEATDGALQRGATIYSRFRPGTKSPAPAGSDDKKTESGPSNASDQPKMADVQEKEAESASNSKEKQNHEGDEDAESEVSPLEALLQMGFSAIEANEALRKSNGNLQDAISTLLAKDCEEVKQLATQTPLPSSPPAQGAGNAIITLASESSGISTPASELVQPATSGATASTSALPAASPTGAHDSVVPPEQTNKKVPRKVVGGEAIENPHWTQKARDAAAAATSSELGKIAVEQVVGRSKAFLEGDAKTATSSKFPRGKTAGAGWAMVSSKRNKGQGSSTEAPGLRRSKSQGVPADSSKSKR